jgi:PAS domain S-box-containing protein
MGERLQVLIVEAYSADVELLLNPLRRAGFEVDPQRVGTEADYVAALRPDLDVVLVDCDLPGFSPARALALLRDKALDVPFIGVGDQTSVDEVVALIRQGAADFVSMRHREQLGDAVGRVLEEKTRRSQGLDALRASQDYARNIIESSLDMIIAVDLDRRIVEFNRAAEETFGYRRDEVLGKSIDMLYADPPMGATISKATSAQGRLVRQVYNRRKNGEVFPTYLAASVLTDARGQPIGLMGISRDISRIKRAEEEIERRANEFSALYETTRDLATQYHLPTLLETIVERATTLLSAAGGGIYLFDRDEGALRFEARKGEKNPRLGTRVGMGDGLAGRVAQTRHPIIVDDYRVSTYQAQRADDLPITAVVAVPMLHGGELIGVLIVNEFDTTSRHFTHEDTRLLELFAAHAASAVHNATLFRQVRASRERLQKLSSSLLRAQEIERRNIARELHDEIGQALTGIQLNFQAIEPLLSDPNTSAMLADSMATIERVLHQVRDLSLNLRPSVLDDFGLVAALNWLVKRQPQGTGLVIELEADPLEPRPVADIETVCFRVTQEALTNAARHAKASRVRIELKKRETELELVIRDNGVGFDVPRAMQHSAAGSSMGLLGMYERVALVGGRIEITSAPAEGTRISAVVPLHPRESFVERRTRRRDPL